MAQRNWDDLPSNEKRFLNALALVIEVIGDDSLRYDELPDWLLLILLDADRNTLFSIIIESLYMLLDAREMERIKNLRRGPKNGARAGKVTRGKATQPRPRKRKKKP